jgi:hypothetical protein
MTCLDIAPCLNIQQDEQLRSSVKVSKPRGIEFTLSKFKVRQTIR